MKVKKILIPIAVLAVTVLSAYSLLTTNIKNAHEYNEILSLAHSYADQGIVDDAIKYYEKALALKCDVDTYIAYVQVYADNGYERKALRTAEQMVQELSDSPKAYKCLLDQYMASGLYEECFQLDDEVRSRKICSDEFSRKMSTIEYAYRYDYQSYSSVNVFSGGYAAVESEGLYGIIDETGSRILGMAYTEAGNFSYYTNTNSQADSGYVIPICTKDGVWQYISTTGNKKIEMDSNTEFDKLGLYIDHGLTAAVCSGTYAYYNWKFEKQLGDYEYASTFNCGCAAVKTGEAEWYIINENGETLNQVPYSDVVLDAKEIAFRNDRAFVMIDGNYYMIDTACNIIGEHHFQDAKPFLNTRQVAQKNQPEESDAVLAAVCADGKWGYVDTECRFRVEPQYQGAHSFSSAFAAVEKDGKWGFIGTDGCLVLDYQFDDVGDFNTKGCVFTSANSKWSLLKLYKYNH